MLWSRKKPAKAEERLPKDSSEAAEVQDQEPNREIPLAEDNGQWQVSRRQLLQLLGVAGAAAAATGVSQAVPGTAADLIPPQLADAPRRVRKWAMVIDLRQCDGCQSQDTPPQCTAACIEGHYAPEPMEWIEVFEQEMESGGTSFLPTPCQQCQNPPCVNVCPVGATFASPEGLVLIDQDRCIGCRMCMAACPYDRRFFNWGNAPVPVEAALADYSVEHQIPAQRGTVMKCDFCPDMARAGRLPFCAQACPQNSIYYGDLEEDIATNGKEVVKLSRFLSENNAYRQKEELGTLPRVFYIPGHGEDAGRIPERTGRLPTRWNWQRIAEGAKRWTR